MINTLLRKPLTDDDREKLKQAATLVQEALGEDSPEAMDNTPRRFAALIEAALEPVKFYDPEEPMKAFPIPDTSNLMVTLQGHAWAVCEHHLQPAEFHARIGYIPVTQAPGYSKPVRLFKQLAHAPMLDERLVRPVVRRDGAAGPAQRLHHRSHVAPSQRAVPGDDPRRRDPDVHRLAGRVHRSDAAPHLSFAERSEVGVAMKRLFAFVLAFVLTCPTAIAADPQQIAEELSQLILNVRGAIATNFTQPNKSLLPDVVYQHALAQNGVLPAAVAGKAIHPLNVPGAAFTLKMVVKEPRNKNNVPDAIEAALLEKVVGTQQPAALLTTEAAYHARPIKSADWCLRCHGDPRGDPDPIFPQFKKEGWKSGVIVGIAVAKVNR
jgi:hypothetical protein